MLQNAPREHFAILSTCIRLSFVLMTFVLSILEWSLKTDFIVVHFYLFIDNADV